MTDAQFNRHITLNAKQKQAYDALMEGKSVFLTGEAGTGKTALVRKFKRDSRKRVVVTSTTGTSALLMGGTTLHSYLGIGLGDGCVEWLVEHIKKKRYLANRWEKLQVLVIDEISMLNPELFDKLDAVARALRNPNKVWGGVQLLLSGDFLQLPVVKCDKFTFEAECWDDAVDLSVCLTENVRQAGDETYRGILARLRMGDVSDEDLNIINSNIGRDVAVNGIEPTKLYAKNADVDRENEDALDKLAEDADAKGETLEFVEFEMSVERVKKVPAWKVDKMKKASIAPDIMQLCIGAQVMLLVNRYEAVDGSPPKLVLSNGSRGVVTNIYGDSRVEVKFRDGRVEEIEEHAFEVNDEKGNVEIILKQIPLRVAYAITIHKSQGITLDCAEVDLQGCFCEGQAYVALSRVKSLDGLSLKTACTRSDIQTNTRCVDFYKAKCNLSTERTDKQPAEAPTRTRMRFL
jgi:ATP-dependent DNA helicase PIF1